MDMLTHSYISSLYGLKYIYKKNAILTKYIYLYVFIYNKYHLSSSKHFILVNGSIPMSLRH